MPDSPGVHWQLHGYRRGHQLLDSNVTLPPEDQRTVDRLSDLAGPLAPGQLFEPYLTAYPLPSGEHYVVARTFQDRTATRPGCVTTRTSLVPMEQWGESTNVPGILAGLMPLQSVTGGDALPWPTDERVATPLAGFRLGAAGPVPHDERAMALVEALFLDEDAPPVVFLGNPPEAEAIAARLLTALWPAARQRFSVCTLAFEPRRLADRYFDLVFAPFDSRARFASEPHRLVGGRDSESGYRLGSDLGVHGGGHAEGVASADWAHALSQQIFGSSCRSLSSLDPFGALCGNQGARRSRIRVVLRWRELTDRVKSSPRAILSIVDIARSLPDAGPVVWDAMLQNLVVATDALQRELPTEDACKLLFTAYAKLAAGESLPTAMPPAKLDAAAELVQATAHRLAERSPCKALRVLAGANADRCAEPVLKGLADGVAYSATPHELLDAVTDVDPSIFVLLIRLSSSFAATIVRGLNAGQAGWITVVTSALSASGEAPAQRARTVVVPRIADDVAAVVLPQLLAGASSDELAELAVETIRDGGQLRPNLASALCDAAGSDHDRLAFRDAVASRASGDGADGFLLACLSLKPVDIEWLKVGEDPLRASRLLRALILQDEHGTDLAEWDAATATDALSVLVVDEIASAKEIATVLALDKTTSSEARDIGFRALHALTQEDDDRSSRLRLGNWLLRTALVSGLSEEQRLGQIVAEFGDGVKARELITLATRRRAAAGRVAANLRLLDAAPATVRNRVVGKIDLLNNLLLQRDRDDFGEGGYRAWASMLADAARGVKAPVETAERVFRFAVRSVNRPVAPLVVACFPILYQRRSSDGHARARRRFLVDDLVYAFVRSAWPPTSLVFAARKAKAERALMTRLRARHTYRAYIAEIERDAEGLDPKDRRRVMKCLRLDS